MKHTTIILSALLLVCILLQIKQCSTQPETTTYKAEKELLSKEVYSLLAKIKVSEHKVDSLKSKKDSVRIVYKERIRIIHTLTPEQQDSLFKLNFPSKDSANLTIEHLKECRIQLTLSDSIITAQDTIIVDLKTVIAIKDKEVVLESNRADNAEKQGKIKSFKAFLWGFGIGNATGYVAGKVF